jgi:hypothetical protein
MGDGGNAGGAVVWMAPGEESSGFHRVWHVTTRADGSYTFTDLAPGVYKIVASQGGFALGVSLLGVSLLGVSLDDEDEMESVAVGAGEKVTKDLKHE